MKIEDALQRFLNEEEECIVYTINNAMITCTIKEMGEGWICIAEKDSESIVNLQNIVRIREYPKNEKGKKKSIFI